ncbi:MAG TPA: methyltransferase domain-containing protein [Rhizomicrobium sp.]|nr:methyltransferase domain-containing protein [Rhizomicrobium sp.]
MSEAVKSYDPHRFRSTVPFYSRYRLAYPQALIDWVIALVGLEPGDAVLDLGCGPGTLAVPFAQAGMRVTGVDPEPAMLAAARETGAPLTLLEGSSFAMPEGIGPFRLVTMGRSFHWMDRPATLAKLDTIVSAGGAVVLFDDEQPRTEENLWGRKLEEIGRRYGRGEEAHIQERDSAHYRRHASYLFGSAFNDLRQVSIIVRHELSADDIVGLAFSLSTSSPEKLGDRAPQFEADLRAELAQLSPDGRFSEIVEMNALVARRST